MKYQKFIFKDYHFDRESRAFTLRYSFDDVREFTETYTFAFAPVEYDERVLDRALQLLFFLAGVSYYKAFLPPEIEVRKGTIDESLADFLRKTYQRGLGEFFYVNKLDPRTPVTFPVTSGALEQVPHTAPDEKLVGIGGGKDSLVSVELLRSQGMPFATWSLNHRPQLTPLIERIGSQHYWVSREWDAQLLELRDDPEAYNGHVPISAIFAAAGTVTAILAGRRDSVVSNENSANEPTLTYEGIDINHQYSKSIEFERDFQAVLARSFGDSVRYYSLLRPFSELRIAELFAQTGFDSYHDVFSSCNHAYRHGVEKLFWDGTCSKCAFVFLALTPFVDRSRLEALFSGKNLLLDPTLEPTYRQLLGIEGDKPLECIGEVRESRAAMRMAQTQYSELSKYQFDLPAAYDFRAWHDSAMPSEVLALLQQAANLYDK